MAIARSVEVRAAPLTTAAHLLHVEARPIEGGTEAHVPAQVELQRASHAEREPSAVFSVLGVCLLGARRDPTAAEAQFEVGLEQAVIEEIHAREQPPKMAGGTAL